MRLISEPSGLGGSFRVEQQPIPFLLVGPVLSARRTQLFSVDTGEEFVVDTADTSVPRLDVCKWGRVPVLLLDHSSI